MNRKGFTLIETIMVVAIIAILSLILVPNVMMLIDENKNKSCKNLLNSIESSASIYVSNNKYSLDLSSGSTFVSLDTLISSGDLKGPITDPYSNNEIVIDSNNSNQNVIVTYDKTTKSFGYSFPDDFVIKCK